MSSLSKDSAILAMSGTSDLADTIIKRMRVSRMVSTSATEDAAYSVIDRVLENLEGVEEEDLPKRKIAEAFLFLIKKINALQCELDELQARCENIKPEISSPQEISDFKGDFMRSLRSGSISFIKIFYNKSQFLDMKPETRQVVAECLVEYAKEKNTEPKELWKVLAANGGNIEQ